MITADEFIQALMFLGLARQMNGSLFLSLALICKFSTLTLMLSYLSFDPSPSLDNHLPPPPPTPFFSPISVHVTEALPMLIIVGGAVGGGCVLLICVITLVSLCCRHTGKGELNG